MVCELGSEAKGQHFGEIFQPAVHNRLFCVFVCLVVGRLRGTNTKRIKKQNNKQRQHNNQNKTTNTRTTNRRNANNRKFLDVCNKAIPIALNQILGYLTGHHGHLLFCVSCAVFFVCLLSFCVLLLCFVVFAHVFCCCACL